MPGGLNVVTAIIPNGTAISNAFSVGHAEIIGLLLPAAWTTANLTLAGSFDGTNFFPIFDDAGTEVTIDAAAGIVVALKTPFKGAIWLKLRSGTNGSPTNQGAARVIQILLRQDWFGN